LDQGATGMPDINRKLNFDTRYHPLKKTCCFWRCFPKSCICIWWFLNFFRPNSFSLSFNASGTIVSRSGCFRARSCGRFSLFQSDPVISTKSSDTRPVLGLSQVIGSSDTAFEIFRRNFNTRVNSLHKECYLNKIPGRTRRSVTWNRFLIKNLLMDASLQKT